MPAVSHVTVHARLLDESRYDGLQVWQVDAGEVDGQLRAAQLAIALHGGQVATSPGDQVPVRHGRHW